MARLWNRIVGSRRQQYARLPLDENEPVSPLKIHNSPRSSVLAWAIVLTAGIFIIYEFSRYDIVIYYCILALDADYMKSILCRHPQALRLDRPGLPLQS
jgi:hypothetical protein